MHIKIMEKAIRGIRADLIQFVDEISCLLPTEIQDFTRSEKAFQRLYLLFLCPTFPQNMLEETQSGYLPTESSDCCRSPTQAGSCCEK
jgi:hypothetical protein